MRDCIRFNCSKLEAVFPDIFISTKMEESCIKKLFTVREIPVYIIYLIDGIISLERVFHPNGRVANEN